MNMDIFKIAITAIFNRKVALYVSTVIFITTLILLFIVKDIKVINQQIIKLLLIISSIILLIELISAIFKTIMKKINKYNNYKRKIIELIPSEKKKLAEFFDKNAKYLECSNYDYTMQHLYEKNIVNRDNQLNQNIFNNNNNYVYYIRNDYHKVLKKHKNWLNI
ncbi:super-infection exclusion protein B [Clostridium chromiireducens]|uniref:super-infection exclusion protein B n=1 Tax=Clostridium chromiireducens TaxID=225345 RepID=UPI003AF848AA